MSTPKISVVTPSYNILPFLKHCIRSVNDQDVKCEHIIIDGDSTDGTKEWLKQEGADIKWISEKDKGMYDALNKGLLMSSGDIICHLNADEQYLTGSLKYIIDFFDNHPDIDYVVADFLLVDRHGDLIAYRKSFPPFWPFFFSNYLYTFTCTLFYRRKVIDQLKYNDSLRSIADVDFLYNVQKMKFKGVHLRKFISVFTYTGKNLSMDPISGQERATYERNNLPSWFGLSKPFLRIAFYTARILYGTLWHRGKIAYEIYNDQSGKERKKYFSDKPSGKWQELKQL